MTTSEVQPLTIRVFADGADLDHIRKLSGEPGIQGFTTNPTLMRQSGITDYAKFAKEVLEIVPDRSVSFEVFSDDFAEMARQARLIASWGPNAVVKIPVTNTLGDSASTLIKELSDEGLHLNVTAVTTPAQVEVIGESLVNSTGAIVSVFAGRIADTGRDPIPIMERSLEILEPLSVVELLWASPREILNVYQADRIGCHIITVTHEMLAKLSLGGKDLTEFSLDTVKMFHNDAATAGFTL